MGRRTSQEQILEWEKHIVAQKKSGLSKSKYCRLNNLNVDHFYYQLKKHAEQVSESQATVPKTSNSEFISLFVEPPHNDDTTPIELSFQHKEQTLSMSVKWSKSELLDFISAWRAS